MIDAIEGFYIFRSILTFPRGARCRCRSRLLTSSASCFPISTCKACKEGESFEIQLKLALLEMAAETSKAPFSLPEIQVNKTGWGPSTIETKFKDMPYQPFSKSDRLGKVRLCFHGFIIKATPISRIFHYLDFRLDRCNVPRPSLRHQVQFGHWSWWNSIFVLL